MGELWNGVVREAEWLGPSIVAAASVVVAWVARGDARKAAKGATAAAAEAKEANRLARAYRAATWRGMGYEASGDWLRVWIENIGEGIARDVRVVPTNDPDGLVMSPGEGAGPFLPHQTMEFTVMVGEGLFLDVKTKLRLKVSWTSQTGEREEQPLTLRDLTRIAPAGE